MWLQVVLGCLLSVTVCYCLLLSVTVWLQVGGYQGLVDKVAGRMGFWGKLLELNREVRLIFN